MKLNVKAMTIAVALIWGVAVLLVGLANLVWEGYGQMFLDCVASVYPGYKATAGIGDVIVGTLYALLDGAIAGLIFALLYNLFATRCAEAAPSE